MKVTIQKTAEWRRIQALPCRTWGDEEARDFARELTVLLRTPLGTMALRPIQAIALHDVATFGGLFAPIRVGGGKSLISLLAAALLKATRPILLLPAALIEKTHREMQEYAKHWKIPRNVQFYSYEMLGRVQSEHFLAQAKPDLIITDESHRLKNRKAGCTRRVARYMDANPETKFVAMSGTILKSSLDDFAHLAEWCLKDGAPVPRERNELEQWALAIEKPDGETNWRGEFRSVDPGALTELWPGERRPRQAFRNRLLATPGVVASTDEGVTCSLLIRGEIFKGAEPVSTINFQRLRRDAETPDGHPCMEAVEIWRHARELSLGFHYRWLPSAPVDWLCARREYAAFIREILSRSRTYDTEHHAALAIDRGDILDPNGLREKWLAVRDSFRPNTVPVWHDRTALEWCAAWGKKTPGIIWTEHAFFARELSKVSGLPYYGRDGVDDNGKPIESADPKRSLIASIAANCTGRNLQAWSRSLLTAVPGATTLEQLIGRTHRDGQRADEVTVDVMIGCKEHFEGIQTAIQQARMIEETSGHSQKLLLADVVLPTLRQHPAFY